LKAWLATEERSALIYRRLSQTAFLWQIGQAGLYRTPELDVAVKWREDERPTAAWAARYAANFDQSLKFLDESRRMQWLRKGMGRADCFCMAG
jgi:hypothetical protein